MKSLILDQRIRRNKLAARTRHFNNLNSEPRRELCKLPKLCRDCKYFPDNLKNNPILGRNILLNNIFFKIFRCKPSNDTLKLNNSEIERNIIVSFYILLFISKQLVKNKYFCKYKLVNN